MPNQEKDQGKDQQEKTSSTGQENTIDLALKRAERGESADESSQGGVDHTDNMARETPAIWEVTEEDKSLAEGTPTDIRDGAAGGEASVVTSGTGSAGSGREGEAISGPGSVPSK